MVKTTLLALAFIVPGSSIAQVVKCVDPSGQRSVTYTQGPCAAGWRAELLEREKTANELAFERRQAQQAIIDKNRRLQRERFEADLMAAQAPTPSAAAIPQAAPAINQSECERARRNAETSRSSITSNRPGDKYAEREMNIKCFGTERAGKIEQARASAPKITVQQHTHANRTLTDQYGNSYQGPRGGTVIRQDGRVCQDLGGTIQCN